MNDSLIFLDILKEISDNALDFVSHSIFDERVIRCKREIPSIREKLKHEDHYSKRVRLVSDFWGKWGFDILCVITKVPPYYELVSDKEDYIFRWFNTPDRY